MEPLKLRPAYKDYLWGGTKLKTIFHKPVEMDIVAESWELSTHPQGDSVIAEGAFAGMPFSAFIEAHPETMGTNRRGNGFPILIKFIDAAQSLSIQVHPDDDYAWRTEGEPGKTEMWYILDCTPGAFLYYGFEREITPEEMRRSIEEGAITEVLHKAPVQPGDVFFIAAGTIHAIGAGILLAEIQENSNTTYRVYDFGRLGADGKPRPLHIDKALEVTSMRPVNRESPGAADLRRTEDYELRRLAKCDYFQVDRLALAGAYTAKLDGSTFVSILCTDGEGTMDALEIRKGDSVFVPADVPAFTLTGRGEFIITTL